MQDNTAQAYATDVGTKERGQHNGGVILTTRTVTEGGIETSVGAKATFECVLDQLLGRKASEGQLMGTQGTRSDREAVAHSRYIAGMRLRRLFTDAGLVGVAAKDPNRSPGKGEISDKRDQALKEYHRIIRSLGPAWGPQASAWCCHANEPPTTEAQKNNCRIALDKLCEVMGL